MRCTGTRCLCCKLSMFIFCTDLVHFCTTTSLCTICNHGTHALFLIQGAKHTGVFVFFSLALKGSTLSPLPYFLSCNSVLRLWTVGGSTNMPKRLSFLLIVSACFLLCLCLDCRRSCMRAWDGSYPIATKDRQTRSIQVSDSKQATNKPTQRDMDSLSLLFLP